MVATLELDIRTGEPYITPEGICPFLDDEEATIQDIRNAMATFRGSDYDAMDFGPDWKMIFTLPGGVDPIPYITMEVTATITPEKIPGVSHLGGLTVDRITDNNARDYKIYMTVILETGEPLTLEQTVMQRK